jgi:hypothetical protein
MDLEDPFPILQLPEGLLDRVVGGLELWDLAAARSACRALRASAGRRARRLRFSPVSLQCESGGDGYVQVGRGSLAPKGGRLTPGGVRAQQAVQPRQAAQRMPREAPPRAPSPPRYPQKRQPTSFQLFPNARELVLRMCELVYPDGARSLASIRQLRLKVPRVFRLPGAPAEAAAARAALAGVTRLEVSGGVLDPAHLAAVLRRLPGLRALALACEDWCNEEREEEDGQAWPDALGLDLVAALAGCPRLESLEWDLTVVYQGAWGLAVRG